MTQMKQNNEVTALEKAKANFSEVQRNVDELASEMAQLRVKRAALADRGIAADRQITELELTVSSTLMQGGDVTQITGQIAALIAEVSSCRSVVAQLDTKIAEADKMLTMRHNTLSRAEHQMTEAEYQELVQKWGEHVKAGLPTFDRMVECARHLGIGLVPGMGWVIDRRVPQVGNLQISLN